MKPDSLFFRLRGVIALVLLLCFVAAFVLSACGPAYEMPTSEDRSATVVAAPSVEPALDRLSDRLDERNNSLSAEVEYLDSKALADRIDAADAPGQADIVLTASREQMQQFVRAGVISGEPLPLASNRLVLVATAENPHNIEDFEDFAARTADLRVSTCAADEPCTEQIADLSSDYDLDLDSTDMTLASSDTDAAAQTPLSELGAGRSDAALAYVTEALAGNMPLQTFEVPTSRDNTTEVWAGMLAQPQDDVAAEDFFAVLAGEEARSAFSEAGFLPAPSAELGASSD